MKKKTIVIILLALLVVGGLGAALIKQNNALKSNSQGRTGGETYDEMTARMHPNQPGSNDMSSHHGGSAQTANDNTNTEMNKISFSSAIGQTAPDFTLTRKDGSKFTLSEYKDKTVVLFFNEGAMCYPACWDQIASLTADSRFNTGEVVTASIVVDTREQWDKIIRSQSKLQSATMLFDTNKAVSGAYDVLNAASSMYKGSFPGHTYYIIRNGIVTFALDDTNMALNNDILASKLKM